MNTEALPVDGLRVQHARCADCGTPDANVLHGDVCPGRAQHHEVHKDIVRTLRMYVGEAPNATVHTEQQVFRGQTQWRTDLSTSQGAVSDGTRREFDITITAHRAPFVGDGPRRPRDANLRDPTDPAHSFRTGPPKSHTARARNVLMCRLIERENNKFRRYPQVTGFWPFVLTTNGARGPASDREWAHWKASCGAGSLLTRTISVQLAHARASCYAF